VNPNNPDRQYDPQPPVPPHQRTPEQPVPTQPQVVRYIAVDEHGTPLPNQPAFIPTSADAAQVPQPQPQPTQPQMVYMSRPLDPAAPEVTEEARRRHEDSKRRFPHLNLSEGEYIVRHVTRHPIGLLSIWAFVGIVVLLLFTILLAFSSAGSGLATALGINVTQMPSLGIVAIPIALLTLLVLIGGYIATFIYLGNRFFLTNESVIQEIQLSLFAKREQTVSLGNIEDASYNQHGIIQTILGYGSIRLSTEGDETTYRFTFVNQPKEQIAILNNAVEAFKNGRPVPPV
jgi:hypothetical protein